MKQYAEIALKPVLANVVLWTTYRGYINCNIFLIMLILCVNIRGRATHCTHTRKYCARYSMQGQQFMAMLLRFTLIYSCETIEKTQLNPIALSLIQNL